MTLLIKMEGVRLRVVVALQVKRQLQVCVLQRLKSFVNLKDWELFSAEMKTERLRSVPLAVKVVTELHMQVLLPESKL